MAKKSKKKSSTDSRTRHPVDRHKTNPAVPKTHHPIDKPSRRKKKSGPKTVPRRKPAKRGSAEWKKNISAGLRRANGTKSSRNGKEKASQVYDVLHGTRGMDKHKLDDRIRRQRAAAAEKERLREKYRASQRTAHPMSLEERSRAVKAIDARYGLR